MGTAIWGPIRADLRRILLSIPGLPPGRKWEGKPYRPTPKIPWLRERIEIGSSVTKTLGRIGLTEENGIYMIDVNWPSDGAVSDGDDLADLIRRTFYHGHGIGTSTPDFIKGSVLSSERLRVVEGDVWTEFPVRIEFFVQRKTLPQVA